MNAPPSQSPPCLPSDKCAPLELVHLVTLTAPLVYADQYSFFSFSFFFFFPSQRAVISIDRDSERNISRILTDVRQQSGTDAGHSQQYSDPYHSGEGSHHYSSRDYQQSAARDPWGGSEDSSRHSGGADYWDSGVDHSGRGGDYKPSGGEWQHSGSNCKEYNEPSRSLVKDSYKNIEAESFLSTEEQLASGSSYSVEQDYQWSTVEEDGAYEGQMSHGTGSGGSGRPTAEDTRAGSTSSFPGEFQHSSVDWGSGSGSSSRSINLPSEHPSTVEGSSVCADGSSSQSSQLVGSIEMDRKLIDELTEAHSSNRKYKEMLVRVHTCVVRDRSGQCTCM